MEGMDTSTNNVSLKDDSEMAECDGEPVVTMMDVLKEQQEFEDDANAVLGASDDKNCTYTKGYVKRQAVYACLTCCSDAKFDPTKRAGVCLACSLNCHENHELLELYTKRSFRCDCGNPKFNGHPCQFTPNKNDLNIDNEYNQNFSGLYCTCHRPYPDPDSSVEEEMIQCIVCEDWLHYSHLDAVVPSNDQYSEMICKTCMDKNDFLHDYSCYAVKLNSENEEVNVDVTETLNNENDNSELCNGSLKNLETIKDIESTTQGTGNSQDESKSESDIGNKPSETAEPVDKMDVDSMTNTTENLEGLQTSTDIEKNTLETNEDNLEKINFTPEVEKEPLSELEKKSPEADEKLSEEIKTDTTEDSIKNEDDSQMSSNNETSKCTLEIDLKEKEDTLKESTQDTSEKNDESNMNTEDKCIDKESKSDEMSMNEEIMSEIDKILGSPYDEESNSASIETDMNECKSPKTDVAGTEQPKNCTTNEACDTGNETGPQNTKDENASAEPADDQNKETGLKEDDANSQNKIGDDKKETDSMDTETLSNQNGNVENSECSQKNAVPESLLNDSKPANKSNSNNDNSINEKSVDATEDASEKTEDIKDSNETSSMTNIASSNETEADSNIDKETINENDVDMNTSMEKQYDMKNSNTAIDGNNVDVEGKKSDASADLQTSETSSDIAIPVISEINSVNENNDSFDQNATLKENKRKVTIEETEAQSCNKKLKINHEERTCLRPKSIKRIFKGATFWPTDFRQKLCTCNECLTIYRELSVLFLIDPEDTVTVYEALGHANTDGTPSQYEKGLQALSSLDRIQQINALTEYNKMRDKLLDFLKSFKDKKEIVKEEDIKAFFAGMKPRKESDGVYFCQ